MKPRIADLERDEHYYTVMIEDHDNAFRALLRLARAAKAWEHKPNRQQWQFQEMSQGRDPNGPTPPCTCALCEALAAFDWSE